MSEFWLALWQECRRLACRTRIRLQLALLQRRTSRAERLLGELAWQQADYAEDDSQAGALQNAERREARLLFEIGETNEQIATLSAALAEENARALQDIAAAENLAQASEQRALAHVKTLHVEKTLGSPDFVLQRLQKSLEAEESALLDLRAGLQHHKQTAEDDRAKNLAVLSQLRSSLKHLQLERSQLQRKKDGHFLGIGQELADAEIAPLNQPGALAEVLDLREKRRRLRATATASLEITQAISPATRILAKLALGLILCGGAILLLQLFRLLRF